MDPTTVAFRENIASIYLLVLLILGVIVFTGSTFFGGGKDR